MKFFSFFNYLEVVTDYVFEVKISMAYIYVPTELPCLSEFGNQQLFRETKLSGSEWHVIISTVFVFDRPTYVLMTISEVIVRCEIMKIILVSSKDDYGSDGLVFPLPLIFRSIYVLKNCYCCHF